jgi:type I restriction enzyme S subunit
MINWKKKTLGELVNIGKGIIQTGPFGSQLHASDYVEVGIPCLMPVNLKQNKIDVSVVSYVSSDDVKRLSKHIVKIGDIVYSRRGDVTQKAIITSVEEGFFCGTGCLLIRTGNSINSRYLFYYLSTPQSISWIKNHAVGITMPNLNTKILSKFPIAFPESIIQQKIAIVLSTLDSKIELNNRINAELEIMAKTLYDYWFVQFDFPHKNGKPYKSSGGKMVWNMELKREIPEGWMVTKVSAKLKTFLGGTPSRSNSSFWNNGDIPWLSSGEVANFPILAANEFITTEGLNNSAAKLLKSGSIMISITGNIRVSILGIDACANQSVVGIEQNSELKNSYIYYFVFNHIEQYEALMTGAVQKHINKEVIDSTPILIPPPDILKQYYDVADPIFNKILVSAIEVKEIVKLRDWILPMLMNGQVKVN